MKKENIIKKNNEFEEMLKIKPYINEIIYIYYKKNNLNINRFGVVVPKKLGKAVIRNKFKRRIKDIIDKYEFKNNNGEYLIVSKKGILEKSYIEINNELKKMFEKIEKEI